jgi:hypothetical protein
MIKHLFQQIIKKFYCNSSFIHSSASLQSNIVLFLRNTRNSHQERDSGSLVQINLSFVCYWPQQLITESTSFWGGIWHKYAPICHRIITIKALLRERSKIICLDVTSRLRFDRCCRSVMQDREKSKHCNKRHDEITLSVLNNSYKEAK